MAPAKKLNQSAAQNLPEYLLVLASLVLGIFHSWAGRYSMNPDGMSYLDVGESFFRHDWANAVNAWWSPLYPWTIGWVLGVVKPGPRSEFPVVHVVNFAIFVIALVAFRFFLHSLLIFGRRDAADLAAQDTQDWPFVLCGYAAFWWVSFEIETLYDVSPDLAVVACFLVSAGILLRLQPTDKLWKFALFGLVLGIGYWTKAVLFPLGFVTLAVGFLWRRSDPKWRTGIVIAGVAFLFVCSPLIFSLSRQKRRFTFGDSGKVNYAWSVWPRSPLRNWQGQEPQGGTPAHPTRQLLEHPPVFEFDGPVVGTYPPWTDPSYWNEGLKGQFRLKPQLEVLLTTVPSEARLLTRAQPGWITGIIALALLGGSVFWRSLRRVWHLIVISLVGMAMYLPLVENDRYLGGFLLVILLLPLWAARLLVQERRAVTCITVAVFASMALGTVDYTVRVLTNHYAIPGVGPNSTLEDVVAAEQLWHLGLTPGDKVAIIGNGTGAYWASLAKVRIVAEIMDTGHGSREFWASSSETRQRVYKLFEQSHAVKVVATCPPEVPEGWQLLTGTSLCIHAVP
jgi:hypothetical protein